MSTQSGISTSSIESNIVTIRRTCTNRKINYCEDSASPSISPCSTPRSYPRLHPYSRKTVSAVTEKMGEKSRLPPESLIRKIREELKDEIDTKISKLEAKFREEQKVMKQEHDKEIKDMEKRFDCNLKEQKDLNKELTLKVEAIIKVNTNLEQELNQLKQKLQTYDNRVNSLISKKRHTSGEESSSTETGESEIKNEEKTLILGDLSLSKISTRDLNKNCVVRTMSDGRMDTLKSWVTEKLNFSVKNCIIYSGLKDIEEECDTNSLLDKLGCLVTELKSKNDDLTVKVCELVPPSESVKEQIYTYNEKIKQWCSQNDVIFLPTCLFFTFGTGEIDTNCFYQSPNHNLNRKGAIRLLDAIAKDSPALVCKDWDRVKSIRNLPRANEFRPHPFTSTQTDRSDDYNSPPTYAGVVRREYHRQPVRGDHQRQIHQPFRNVNNYQNNYSRARRNVGCYICGGLDHFKIRCPFLPRH